MLTSPEYLAVLVATHARDAGWGGSSIKRIDETLALIDRLDAKTVLDYGCGKGHMTRLVQQARPNVRTDGYDPAAPGWPKEGLLEKYDVVFCYDVLEHVEYEFVDEVLAELSRYGRYVRATIGRTPASKILTDGRNAHLIVEQYDWWGPRLPANAVLLDTRPNRFIVEWANAESLSA